MPHRTDKPCYLDFASELDAYVSREFYKRSNEDIDFIITMAKRFTCPPQTRLWLMVPFFFREDISTALLTHIHKALSTRDDIVVIFFFNGWGAADASELYEAKLQAAKNELVFPRYSNARFFFVERRFDAAPGIGRLRGLMSDSVMLASRFAKLRDPFILYNDADICDVSDSYFNALIQTTSPTTKLVAGPVHYGYRGRCLSLGTATTLHAPELFLFETVNAAIKSLARTGRINFEKRVWPDGANMMVSCAAYCAVGGFDYGKLSGEDDALGRALHRYNPNHVSSCASIEASDLFEPDTHLSCAYCEDAWIVTDPRRVLMAINAGYTGAETWQAIPFERFPGSQGTSVELLEAYQKNNDLVQIRDLIECNTSSITLLRREIIGKVIYIILRSAQHDFRVQDDEQLKNLLVECRLISESEACILQSFDELPEKVEWKGSGLMRAMCDLTNDRTRNA